MTMMTPPPLEQEDDEMLDSQMMIRFKKYQEEKEHKEKEEAEAHLYTIIQVARDEDLAQQIGKDIYFNLVDHEKVRSFRVQNQLPFNLFKDEVAKEFGVPIQYQRYWLWAKRQNHIYRPNRPLHPQEEAQSVLQLKVVSNNAYNAELRLFLEVELGPELRPLPLPDKTNDDILLFFKLYDPEKEELRYVGRLFVKALGQPLEILSKLNQMAGFPQNEEIELYEEIRFEPSVMCEFIDEELPFRLSQLEDGDIICYQKASTQENEEKYRYPDVPSFLKYVHNRQVVHFRSLKRSKEDDFSLELSKLFTYDDVVERLARHIGLEDSSKIQLTSHSCLYQQPFARPIKYRGVERLSDMLVHYNQTSDILYYEVLDIPHPESQGLKTLKVVFHHAMKDEVVIHNIRLSKRSTVADVISDLKTKVELSHPNAELRLIEILYHKIYKIFPPTEKIENINDQYWTLRAEEIPEEEKNLGPHDRLIHVYHFLKDPNQNQMEAQNFGEPFFLVIHDGETLVEIKLRIQKKLQVPDEEFSKWKFALLSLGRLEYLQDSDIIAGRFQQRRDIYGAWEQYLGLEHSDSTPKRAYTANQVNKSAKTFHEKEYSMDESLCRIYGYTTATGSLQHPSTKIPSNTKEEETEESQTKSVNVSMDDEKYEDVAFKRKLPSKRAKKTNMSEVIANTMQVMSENSKRKLDMMERKMNMSFESSSQSSKSLLSECMSALNLIEDIDDVGYFKVLQKFQEDSMWMSMFLHMPDSRRKSWILSLK